MDVPAKKEIIAVFKKLEKVEYRIAKLYEKASLRWTENALFWQRMSEQETSHGKGMKNIISILKTNPDRYIETAVFNEPPIWVIEDMIKRAKVRMRKKDTIWKTMLYLARDIESSIVETQLDRILDIDNKEISSILEHIQVESRQHLAQIEEKLGTIS